MGETSVQERDGDRDFEDARRGLRELGGSAWEYDIVDLLARHGAAEGALLQQYERLAAEATSPVVRYVTQLILDDERRHHRMLAEMANAIAWSLPDLSPSPAVPSLPSPADPADVELVAATRALIDHEHHDREDLKRLRRQVRPYADTTLWSVLIDSMLLDTDKHIRLLRFVEEHLR